MDGDLIPGLPNDVSLTIMARVPRRCHGQAMSKVCSSWRQTVRSRALFEERRRLHATEPWLYAAVVCTQEDRPAVRWFARSATNLAESSAWWPLEPMPERHRPVYGFRCVAMGDLLFVLGGCEWRPSARIFPSTNRVSVFNARTNRWTSAPEMITARADFACGVAYGVLMVAGGNRFIGTHPNNTSWMDDNANLEAEIDTNSLKSAEAYDPSTNTWAPLPDMIETKHFVSGCVMNSKFAVCGFRYSADMKFWEIAEMYEPERNRWVEVDLQAEEGLHLFQLDPSEGILLKYDGDLNAWKALAASDMASAAAMNRCQRGSGLFVLGDGLAVVRIGMEEADGQARIFTSGSQCHGTLQSCQIIAI